MTDLEQYLIRDKNNELTFETDAFRDDLIKMISGIQSVSELAWLKYHLQNALDMAFGAALGKKLPLVAEYNNEEHAADEALTYME